MDSDKRLAISSLVLGVIGLFYGGLIMGGLAIIFSLIAIGRGYIQEEATGGLVIGLIDVCALLVEIIGVNYYFAKIIQVLNQYNMFVLLFSSPYMSYYMFPFILTTATIVQAHSMAIAISMFLSGPIPFHWFYALLFSL